ncbi:NAD(P)/FAD-dependent oxidoreductase [Costertonia aggregata]|uniref:FAD-dependent oxidoreductase n=1 Tax=Costertonia aggregata TaxID=343403 RepID=A0A7H9AQR1_9FLAO|nr:FAD-dependent oxidoreductase [Costertonia aggregata]QLG45831.1 FAD-dependent oxidoreductase [Costertonia aggregata]
MLDYLIVGLGLAGTSFAETLEKHGKTFKVISDDSQIASKVAAGLYNPVILKRFTLAWNAVEQFKFAAPFYRQLEKKLSIRLDHKIPVMRRFAGVEEQNLWFEASDKVGLREFMSPQILDNTNPNIDAPFGYGEVLHTGKIDTATLLKTYSQFLSKNNRLIRSSFDYNTLRITKGYVEYDSVKAKQIVFCEGFGLKQNPYFNYLPLTGTKGEYLFIKAPKLKVKAAIKASIFCISEENDVYRVGATYKWKDTTNLPTEETRKELLQKLNSFIECDYEVIDQVAGIRPTVTDRRPLVGQHPEHKNLFVLNGFGSRGVMIAPSASQQLYHFIEEKSPISQEMDISRFRKKYVMNSNV